MSNAVVGEIDIVASITASAQDALDAFARSRGYDDMRSLVSYDGDFDVTFAAEGARGKLLRSQMWAALRGVQDQVIAGTRAQPRSWEELAAEPGLLPPLTWT